VYKRVEETTRRSAAEVSNVIFDLIES